MKVKIPFKERFREPMLKGVKKWTSRTKRCGHVNDEFEAFGQTFVITKVEKMLLRHVAKNYIEEGFTSEDELIAFWNKLHPRKGFQPSQLVWVHEFQMVIE